MSVRARRALSGRALRGAVATATVVVAGLAASPAHAPSAEGGGPRLSFSAPGAEQFPARFEYLSRDYVVRGPCRPLHLRIHARRDTRVSVNGSSPRTGRFSLRLPLAGGEAAVLTSRRGSAVRRDYVRCLPRAFPNWQYRRYRPSRRDFYAVTPNRIAANGRSFSVIFDVRGVPVWWYAAPFAVTNATPLAGGRVAWARRIYFAEQPYEVRALDGSLLRVARTFGSFTDSHDLQELPGGNLLLLTYRPRGPINLSAWGGPADATVLDAEVQEIGPHGFPVWAWNSAGKVKFGESRRWYPYLLARPRPDPTGGNEPRYDTTHINSVEPAGGSVIISLRHTDAVYSIDRAGGAIEWKLGGTPTPERLEIIGDPRGQDPFGGQHDARILRDGTLALFDNATDRGGRPRAVRYRIDTEAMTATLIEQVTDPLVSRSPCCGNARRGPDGSWVAAWGRAELVSEFNRAGKRTFTLRFGGRNTYRVVPADGPLLTRAELRAGMDARFPSLPFACRLDASTTRREGTAAADVLVGGASSQALFGRGGGDRISGGHGRDCAIGGAGHDRLDGGAGADSLNAGPGDDVIRAGRRDRVRCGAGRDTVILTAKPARIGPSCERIRG